MRNPEWMSQCTRACHQRQMPAATIFIAMQWIYNVIMSLCINAWYQSTRRICHFSAPLQMSQCTETRHQTAMHAGINSHKNVMTRAVIWLPVCPHIFIHTWYQTMGRICRFFGYATYVKMYRNMLWLSASNACWHLPLTVMQRLCDVPLR